MQGLTLFFHFLLHRDVLPGRVIVARNVKTLTTPLLSDQRHVKQIVKDLLSFRRCHRRDRRPGCGFGTWLWLRNRPRSALSVWFHERVSRNGGRLRKTTIVALARKLLVALWKYVTTGVVIEGVTMKA
jgi:hypothetical protein